MLSIRGKLKPFTITLAVYDLLALEKLRKVKSFIDVHMYRHKKTHLSIKLTQAFRSGGLTQ